MDIKLDSAVELLKKQLSAIDGLDSSQALAYIRKKYNISGRNTMTTVRSHIGWRGEQNIVYKSVEILRKSPKEKTQKKDNIFQI